MKERVKTFLLFLLVFTSFFLTQQLWIQLPSDIVKVFKTNEALSASYALSDMIAPNKLLLNFGENIHTMSYDDSKNSIWSDSKAVLSAVLGSDEITIEEISKDQYIKFQEERSLVFYFPEKINTYILAKTLDVRSPNTIADTVPNINDIYIYLGNEGPFFVFSDENKYLLAYDINIDNTLLKEDLTLIEENKNFDYYYSMRKIYEKIYEIENDIYILFEMNTSLPTMYVSNEIVTLNDDAKRQIAERFFTKEIDYIREIVESNGSAIYVYNNRVLKLNVNGTLEYFHALEEKVSERNLYNSLNTASEFITQNTLLQKGMYLSNIEEIESDSNQGYRLTFKYRIRGIPILLGNREVGDYIQIEVFNDHVRSYKQLARGEMDMGLNTNLDRRPMLSSSDIIDKNIDFLEREYLLNTNKTKEEIGENTLRGEVLSSVDDISLAYYDPNLKEQYEKLIGVWAIRMNDRLYAFNVYTGNLVFER